MSQQVTPAGSQARKLIAATLALVGCRVVSEWNNLLAGFAAVVVMLVLAASIVAGMPRLRRILLIAALPASTLANAVALGLGAFIMLLGTQGLLADGRIGHRGPPWNVAFALVPTAAAANLIWLARPISTARWLNCLWLMNLASAAYSVWCWHATNGFSFVVPPPVAPTILLGLAALSMATLTWDGRAQASSSHAGPGRGRRLFVLASALLTFAAIWLTLFPAYSKRQVIHSLETHGWHANCGVIFPGWKLPFEIPFEWYAYLGEVSGVWSEGEIGDVRQVGELLNSLPCLDYLRVNELHEGAERLLQPLAGNTRLRRIILNGAGVTDETLADAARVPGLNVVRFERSQITDAGLANLASLQWLEFLAVRQTRISGDGLAHLGSLPRLTRLDLNDTDVGDRQMAELPRFKTLRSVSLNNTRLTDEGLTSLARSKTLMWIELGGTRVTESGVNQLRRALPKCAVIWHPAPDE